MLSLRHMDKPIQMVDLVGQYHHIKKEVDKAIQAVLEQGHYINGQIVKTFARNLEKYLDVKHVIPCGNGTDAIQIALMALELSPGDEVITTPFTFVATAEVIVLLGLKPVFVDIDPDTFNMNVEKIEEAITSRTKCILPVHLFGQCCNMESILEIANRYGLYVIEDNAQAIGADYLFKDGRTAKAGTIGHIGTTSFYPSKNLGAYGDAGAIFTNDDNLADKMVHIVNHGSRTKYHYHYIGVNSRLDSIQACVLDIKLKYLDEYRDKRIKTADNYDRLLENIPQIRIPKRSNFTTHVFHQYTLRCESRNELQQWLKENKIPNAIYYPIPLHMHNPYKKHLNNQSFPVAESCSENVLSLPIHTELPKKSQSIISSHIEKYYNR